MIFDSQLEFSDDQAITATAISTNVVQWPAMGTAYGAAAAMTREIGDGQPVPLLVQVTADFATLTSLTITLEHADDAGLSTNNEVLWSSGAIAVADLVEGKQVPIRFMPKQATREYLGLRYTVGGASATSGTISAGIVGGIDSNWQ